MLRNHRRAIRAVALVAGAGVALALVPTGAAAAHPSDSSKHSCDNRNNNTIQATRVRERRRRQRALEALQAIADANGGNRAANTPGYEASVDYVVDTLKAAGWKVGSTSSPSPTSALGAAAAHPGQRDLGDAAHRHRVR